MSSPDPGDATAPAGTRRSRPARESRIVRGAGVAAVALLGAGLAVAAAGGVERPVGPVRASLDLGFDTAGGTTVEVGPLGSLVLDTHAGPARLDVRLTGVDEASARSFVDDPTRLATLGERLAADVRAAVVALAVKTALVALAGAALLTALATRSVRAVLGGAVLVLAVLGIAAGVGRATFRPEAVVEPRYEGLLVNAPAIVGDARDIVERFEQYRQSLAAIVTNVSTLYTAGRALPTFTPDPDTVSVLHVSDLHLNPTAFDLIGDLAEQFRVDAVLDTGDIVDWGSEPESRFVRGIGGLDTPYVYVRGNHDSTATQAAVAAQPNAVVLDGQAEDVAGLVLYGLGDPRFTPDSSTRAAPEQEARDVVAHGRRVARALRDLRPRADALLLHDPIVAATTVAGDVPLVLAGHTHQRDRYVVDGTLVMVQGSTGGAGLRGLEGEQPTPLSATVLYLDRDTSDLRAFDDVTLGGLGTSSVTINRTVVTTEYLASVTREATEVVPDTGPTPLPEARPGGSGEPSGAPPPSGSPGTARAAR